MTQALSPNASDFFNSLLSGSLSSWHEPWAMPTDRTADRGAGSCANQATSAKMGSSRLLRAPADKVCLTLRRREMDSNYWYRGTKAVDFQSIPGIAGIGGLVNDTT